MVRALLIASLAAALAGCAYHCRHERWEPHRNSCYVPTAAGPGGSRDGLSGSWNEYYSAGGCDGLSYRGVKERCERD